MRVDPFPPADVKPTKRVSRTFRIPPDVSRRIDRLARESELSFSTVVTLLLREALAEDVRVTLKNT